MSYLQVSSMIWSGKHCILILKERRCKGWEAHDVEALSADMELLRKRLSQTRSRKTGIWLAVAAVILLIIGIGYVFQFFTTAQKSNEQSIAIKESRDSTSIDSLMADEKIAMNEVQAIEQETEPEPKVAAKKKAQPIQKADKKEELIALNTIPEPAPVAVPQEEEVTEDFELAEIVMDEMIVLEEAPMPRAKKSETDARSRLNATGAVSRAASAPLRDGESRMIYGLVFDENEEVLPGASVVVKGSNQGTVTDINGYFELPVKGEKSTLIFYYIGFATAEREITTEETIKVEMQQDLMALEEVVVIGYGTQSKSDVTGSISTVEDESFSNNYEKARPSLGWEAFEQAIKKNKQMPEKAQRTGISGKVKLKLTISASGVVTDIEVKKGLGYGCDEEAIRIVKAAGTWIPAKQNELSVESTQIVKVEFP